MTKDIKETVAEEQLLQLFRADGWKVKCVKLVGKVIEVALHKEYPKDNRYESLAVYRSGDKYKVEYVVECPEYVFNARIFTGNELIINFEPSGSVSDYLDEICID